MEVVNFEAGVQAIVNDNHKSLSTKEEFFWPAMQERVFSFPVHSKDDQMSPGFPLIVTDHPMKKFQNISREIEPHIHKIAVLRSNGIGDLIFALPALNALRLAYPDAEIVLLGLDWHAQFLTGRPGPVDRVVVIPRSRGVRDTSDFTDDDPNELDRFFRVMQEEHFDLAIQMHGGGRYSNPFVNRLGARLTIGLRSPDAVPLDRWVPYSYFQMEILRYLEVVSLVGANLANLEPQVNITEQDLAESREVVPESKKPLVVIHPGAGDPRRRWPVEKFAAVGNALAWAGAHVAVIGTEAEHDLVAGVVNEMSAKAQNLCGHLSLGGLAGLLARASVMVSNDSGPLHLAAAVDTATVGIYWCGNLITAGPVTRSRHRPAISWRLDCPVCGLNCTRNSCEHAVSFVADVSQEEVTTLAVELASLSERPVHAPLVSMLSGSDVRRISPPEY